MLFQNVDDALRALEDLSASPALHQEAIHYLASLDECYEAKSLVRALHNDDLGVRWEAGNLLATMEERALPEILKALRDPHQVGHPRFRESVLHVIHTFQDPLLKSELEPLSRAMKGVNADIETMQEAYRLLKKIDPTACEEGEQ